MTTGESGIGCEGIMQDTTKPGDVRSEQLIATGKPMQGVLGLQKTLSQLVVWMSQGQDKRPVMIAQPTDRLSSLR